MPRLRKGQVPGHRLHRASGLGHVVLAGRTHYTAAWGSPEADAAYDALVRRWLAGSRRPLPLPRTRSRAATIAELTRAYEAHVRGYYRKRGRITPFGRTAVAVMADWRALHGPLPLAELTRAHLKEMLAWWLATPRRDGRDGTLTRATINQRLKVLKAAIRWGADEWDGAAVPAAVVAEAAVVRPLARGRSRAAERPAIKPADPDALLAVLAWARPQLRAMLRVQRSTGMRPGELCALRPSDLDRSAEPWRYAIRPDHDKQAHTRLDVEPTPAVLFGPRARAALEPLLAATARPDMPVFRTRSGRQVTPKEYYFNLRYACRRAGVAPFSPQQLRHLRLTEIRATRARKQPVPSDDTPISPRPKSMPKGMMPWPARSRKDPVERRAAGRGGRSRP